MKAKLVILVFLSAFLISGYSLMFEKKIKPDSTNDEESFAYAVDMDGDRAIVGAPITSPYQNIGGSVYIYERQGSFKQLARIKKWNNDAYRNFGTDVSISGDYAIIGAPTSQLRRGITSGTAYIFKRQGGSWVEQSRLKGETMRQGVDFGQAVDIDGDYAIVGAHDYDRDYGAAYIFKRTGDTWVLQAKLKGEGGGRGDKFGISVTIEGNYVAVGAPQADNGRGHVYIFYRDGENWLQHARLNAEAKSEINANTPSISRTIEERSDATTQIISSVQDGAIINSEGDNFGRAIDLEGGNVIIGAPGHDYENGGDYDEGAAYVFNVKTASLTHKLRNKEGRLGNIITPQFAFGSSVAISGDHYLVGAVGAGGVNGMTGGAYLFIDGRQKHYYLPSDAKGDIGFGQALALSDILCPWIGAPAEGYMTQKYGAVYHYCE